MNIYIYIIRCNECLCVCVEIKVNMVWLMLYVDEELVHLMD